MSSHHSVPAKIHEEPHNVNVAAPGVSYFTPQQNPPAGTAIQSDESKPVPKLFQPLKLRGMTLQNRIMLSPLCQYSAEDGHYTMWHKTHMGGIIQRGPGLSTVEATAVTPEGRITPEDVGLWQDSQMKGLQEVVEFAHSQNQKMMIQIAHAGRKASTVAPWLSSGEVAGKELNGWPDNVYGPSAIQWNDKHAQPKEMTLEDIENFKQAYKAAVERALKCGFDAIEIHNAHGYLLQSFLSPVSNHRTDKYGGSFENRTRLTLEIVDLCRSIIPKDMPLFLRISATDWLEEQSDIKESWTGDDTVRLAPLLAEHGVDLLDVSSGGNHPAQHPHVGPSYQAPFAIAVKKAVGDKMAVATVGSITGGKQANELLEGKDGEPGLDLIVCGRMFQKNPGLVWAFAEELGVEIQLANQIRWGFGGRGAKAGKPVYEPKGQTKI
ncbi:NADH-dependent flavin oxidoreductase [Elasticomyces elasticus]|nr:NADH-dependent flavin oxidoreductase [Elasticomyces elasticus]